MAKCLYRCRSLIFAVPCNQQLLLQSIQKRHLRCALPGEASKPSESGLTHLRAQVQTTAPDTSKKLEETSLPKTFSRLVASRTGSSFREVATVVELPLELPGPGEVLVKLHWAGVNGGCETFRVRGEHAFQKNKDKQNFPLGAEGSGVIVAVGQGVDKLKVGEHIACNRISAFSEYGITRSEFCVPVNATCPEAAALTQSAVTACTALEVVGELHRGETVLVTAAAGGTGHFAVQLAKLCGCHVIATCGSSAKAQALRQLGADRVIDYKTEDMTGVLQVEYPNGIDMVYEGVGGRMLKIGLERLGPNGRLILVGYISQYPHSNNCKMVKEPLGDGLPSVEDLFWGAMTIKKGNQTILCGVMPKNPESIQRCRSKVFQLFKEGKLIAWIDKSRSFKGLESISSAIEHMLEGSHIGKVVVQI